MENLILKQDELATTASVKAMTENLINGVNNGEIDPLRLQVFFAAVEKMAKAVKDAVRDNSVDFAFHLFAPFHESEFLRVLKDNGVIITAVPGKNHLFDQ